MRGRAHLALSDDDSEDPLARRPRITRHTIFFVVCPSSHSVYSCGEVQTALTGVHQSNLLLRKL